MASFAGPMTLSRSQAQERASFIRRSYMHLALAILAFVGLESMLLQSALAPRIMQWAFAGPYNWLMLLGAFMVVGWVGRGFASRVESLPMQYLGLAIYILAEAVIFIPLLLIAQAVAPGAIGMAAIMTTLLFVGLTATVFITRTDFSFLRSFLMIGGFIAIGLIVCGVIFGFNLGLVFSGAMVALAAGGILYDTSNVLLHYRTDQHVAASLELFASVALMFWYVLRILIALSSRD